MKRKAFIIAMVAATILSAGCSNLVEPGTNKPVVNPTLWRDLLHMNKTDKVFQKNNDELIQPAMKLGKQFYAEIEPWEKEYKEKEQKFRKKEISQAELNTARDELYKKEAELASSKYLAKIKELRELLDKEEVMKGNDGMMYYGKQYLHAFQERLENTVSLGNKQGNEGQIIGQVRQLDYVKIKEAEFGYNHEWNLMNGGKGTYELTFENYRLIKKGQNYQQVMSFFKMPGQFIPAVKEYDAKTQKISWHQGVIWAQKDTFVYVEFMNGRAANWHQWQVNGWKSPRL